MQNLPTVAVVWGKRGCDLTFQALDLVNYKKALTGFDKVVIKVNFIVNNSLGSNLDTDPLMVEAIILKLKEMKIKQIFVAESDSTVTDANSTFQTTGMKEVCDRQGVEFVNLSDIKRGVKITVPKPEKLKTVSIPKLINESAVINASTRNVMGIKNMFGLLSNKTKTQYFAKGINAVSLDIASVIKPKLTIISGFVGYNKSLEEKRAEADLIVAGDDVIATDATTNRILGYNPSNIDYLRKANEKGLGNLNANVVGLSIDEAAKKIEEENDVNFLLKVYNLYKKQRASE